MSQRKNLKYIKFASILSLLTTITSKTANAVDAGCDKISNNFQEFTGTNPGILAEQCASPGGLLSRAINLGLGLVAGLSVLFLIVGGFRYLTASGDSTTTGNAKKNMYWAVIGLGVAILGYAIVAITSNLVTSKNIWSP